MSIMLVAASLRLQQSAAAMGCRACGSGLRSSGLRATRFSSKMSVFGLMERSRTFLRLHRHGRKRFVLRLICLRSGTDLILQLLRDYSAISCLDSTHNTCFSANGKEEKAFLYTLVVKNLVTGKGVPAAFMISPGESQWPVSDWLSWLVKPVASGGLGYKGKRWMIDCSDAEAAAIRNTVPGAEIIVCMWHVYKAVAEQTKKKLDVCSISPGQYVN